MGGNFGPWWNNHQKSVGGELLPQGIPQIRCQLFSLGNSPERTLPDFCLRQDIGLMHTVCQHSRKGAGVWSMALPIFTFWMASHPTPCCFYISFTQRTTECPGYWEWGEDPYHPMYTSWIGTHPHLVLPERYPCHLLALASCVSLVNWLDPHRSQLCPTSTPSLTVMASSTPDCSCLLNCIEIHYQRCPLSSSPWSLLLFFCF